MLNFDGTCPLGNGPGRGRGFGHCYGLGWKHHNHHRGLGRYCGCDYPETKEEKKKALSEYAQALREETEDVEKELSELENQT